MDDRVKEEIAEDFCQRVARKYRYHCARCGEEPTQEGLLRYAVSAQIIKERTVAHYMVMELYPAALYNASGWLEAVKTLSLDTGLCERTVRGLVSRPHRYSAKK